MLNPVTIAVVAASVWAAVALALPANAVAKNAEATPAATSTDVTARGQATAPVAKRVRRASMQPRRVAAVAPAPYYSQCFLFWCRSGSRSFNFLMLGVAF